MYAAADRVRTSTVQYAPQEVNPENGSYEVSAASLKDRSVSALFAAIEEGNVEAVKRISSQLGSSLKKEDCDEEREYYEDDLGEEEGDENSMDELEEWNTEAAEYLESQCDYYASIPHDGNVEATITQQLATGLVKEEMEPQQPDVHMTHVEMAPQPNVVPATHGWNVEVAQQATQHFGPQCGHYTSIPHVGNVGATMTQQLATGAHVHHTAEQMAPQQPNVNAAAPNELAAAAFLAAIEAGDTAAVERLAAQFGLRGGFPALLSLLKQYLQAQGVPYVSRSAWNTHSVLPRAENGANASSESGEGRTIQQPIDNRDRARSKKSPKAPVANGNTSSSTAPSVSPGFVPSQSFMAPSVSPGFAPSSQVSSQSTEKKQKDPVLLSEDIWNDVFGKTVVPDGAQQQFTENGKKIFHELSEQNFSTTQELLEAYENLAKTCVPPRTYEETLQICGKVQNRVCHKHPGEARFPSCCTKGVNNSKDKKKYVRLTLEERKELLQVLEAMTPEMRTEAFKAKKFMRVSGATAMSIWHDADEIRDGRCGRVRKLSERTLNEIFAEACARHEAGVPFSPQTLKWYISQFAETESKKKAAPPPSARTLETYYTLLKRMGLKITQKSQLSDIKKWMGRLSFRNAAATYAVAKVTHDKVSQDLILSLCQTTAIFGEYHQLKIITVANFSGVGPFVLLVKVPDSDLVGSLVKVPLYGCHPAGPLTKCGTSVWFHTMSSSEIMREFVIEIVQLFLHELRLALAEYLKNERAVLWVDCSYEVSNFFMSDEGSDWALKNNVCVNMEAPKYTGTQLGLDNAFRDTKQLIRDYHQNREAPSIMVASFERGIRDRVKLRALKSPLLEFLAKLNVVLPHTLGWGTTQKAFSALLYSDLNKCMSRCPDYSLAIDAEKERLRTIVDQCVEKVREKGEITQDDFDFLKAPEDPWTQFDETSNSGQRRPKRVHILTHPAQVSERKQKLQAEEETLEAKEKAKRARRERNERKEIEAQENRKRKALAREIKQKALEQAKKKKKEEKQAKKAHL